MWLGFRLRFVETVRDRAWITITDRYQLSIIGWDVSGVGMG